MSQDVRAIANYILDLADEAGLSLTNMALNKLVYFAYEDYLLNSKQRLTDAKIEAWEHGPVFREIYHSFKKAGDAAIGFRATRVRASDGELEVCRMGGSAELQQSLRNSVVAIMAFSAAKLRNLSHLPGSPWDKVWNHSGHTNAGMEISDKIIFECFNDGWRQ